MFRLLVVTVALSACMADEKTQESASPSPIIVQDKHARHAEQRRLRDGLQRLRYDLQRLRGDLPHQHDLHRHYDDQRRQSDDWYQSRDHYEDDPQGPVILRSIRPHEDGHKPDIARQNKIIADVYSPDYAQPTWVLDYRYLKTGGRDYTRGPGGQIIILPKGIRTNEQKEFSDYDELIENLRLKALAERKKPQYFMPLGEGQNRQRYGYDNQKSMRKEDMQWWRDN